MSLSVQQLLGDAKRLAMRLREHDDSANRVVSNAQETLKAVMEMKSYQEDIESLNAIAHNRPRPQLVLGIQQENRHIRQLQQENKELRAALEEHQNAIELIMSKYRQHMMCLVNSSKVDKNALKQSKSRMLQERVDKICEMAAVMNQSIRIDEKAQTQEQEVMSRLITENKGLREMLEISCRNGSYSDPLCGPRLTSKECQTEAAANDSPPGGALMQQPPSPSSQPLKPSAPAAAAACQQTAFKSVVRNSPGGQSANGPEEYNGGGAPCKHCNRCPSSPAAAPASSSYVNAASSSPSSPSSPAAVGGGGSNDHPSSPSSRPVSAASSTDSEEDDEIKFNTIRGAGGGGGGGGAGSSCISSLHNNDTINLSKNLAAIIKDSSSSSSSGHLATEAPNNDGNLSDNLTKSDDSCNLAETKNGDGNLSSNLANDATTNEADDSNLSSNLANDATTNSDNNAGNLSSNLAGTNSDNKNGLDGDGEKVNGEHNSANGDDDDIPPSCTPDSLTDKITTNDGLTSCNNTPPAPAAVTNNNPKKQDFKV